MYLDIEEVIEHHEIAVKLPPGADPDELAARYGYKNKGQIGSLEGYYLFDLQDEHKEKRDVAAEKADTLIGSSEVEWAEKQKPKERHPRPHHRRHQRDAGEPW